jgi:RimJ/RimL family protein N-acetyltransferase
MFARTPRLLLRPGWPEDAAALTAAIADEGIVRNLASAPWPYTENDARAFLSSWSDGPRSNFVMVQRTAAAPRVIGCIGIDAHAEGGHEIGYWIARPYWGLGYATEAGRHMIDLARTLGITELKAGHFIDNPASGTVLRKLGFRATGRVAMRTSKGRGTTVATAEYVRSIEAPGNDAGDAGVAPMDPVGRRMSDTMREEWRQIAA